MCGAHFSLLLSGIWCWGENINGQVGDGSNIGKNEPVKIGELSWMSVSAGSIHTCGIQEDNLLWCWGENYSGQLGNGTNSNKSLPVKIGEASWLSVEAGVDHTCGILADHSLWCWGLNNAGQLGDGDAWADEPVLVVQ